jgi:hypothetical protein
MIKEKNKSQAPIPSEEAQEEDKDWEGVWVKWFLWV